MPNFTTISPYPYHCQCVKALKPEYYAV